MTPSEPLDPVVPVAVPASAVPGDTPAGPSRWRSTLYDLFVETFAVVLGVTLALLVNDWQSARTDAARAAQVRASLMDELRANRALVVDSRDYHRGLLDSLGAFSARGATAVSPLLFSRGFVHPATTTSTAWDAAASTGALGLLDYDDVLALSRVYAAQESYRTSHRTTGQIIYQALYDVGTAGVAGAPRKLVPLIAASMYLEDHLVTELDSALAAVAPR